MLGEGHVMRKARPRQRDGDIRLQPVIRPDDPIVHVGRVLGVVEEHQLACGLVHLGVGGDAIDGSPAFDPLLLQGHRVEAIALATLVEGRERPARVNHDICR